jgi:hypothetical protein
MDHNSSGDPSVMSVISGLYAWYLPWLSQLRCFSLSRATLLKSLQIDRFGPHMDAEKVKIECRECSAGFEATLKEASPQNGH